MVRQHDDHGHNVQPTCRSRRHGPGTAPPTAPGQGICPACRDVVEEALIELPALFELCAHALDLRPNEPRERVSGHRPRGIVLREAVVSVRSDILSVLASWCGLVTTERGVLGPDELDVRKLVGFLAIHLHWLCQHPAAADFVDELTDLTDAANEAMKPETGFRVAVGTCLHPDCDRTVYAEAHREGAAPYEVSCEAGHVWAPEHWLALRGRQNGTNGTRGTNGSNGSNGNGSNGHVNGQQNGHANGHVNGHTNGRKNGNGHVNGHKNGQPNAYKNGQVTGRTNGQTNGRPKGEVNGQANGHVDGQVTGRTNGEVNGQVNSQANGHLDGPVTGHTNGHLNSHTDTQANGHPNGQAGHKNEQVNGHSRRAASGEGAE